MKTVEKTVGQCYNETVWQKAAEIVELTCAAPPTRCREKQGGKVVNPKFLRRLVAFILCGLMIISALSVLFYASAAENETYDLSVTSVVPSTSNVYDGDKIVLNAIIRNMGDFAINTEIPVSFYVDGRLVETVKFTGSIEAGGKLTARTTVAKQMTFGTHKLTAAVNENASIIENDYSNNSIKKRITVIDGNNPNPPSEPLPVEPTMIDTVEPTVIEAEDCERYMGTYISSESAGYRGTGYINGFGFEGSGITIKFVSDVASNYSVTFRYTTATNEKKQLSYALNNPGNSYSPINFEAQPYNDSWRTKTLTMFMQKGENTVKLFTAKGNSGGVYIDRVEFVRKMAKKITGFKFLKKDNPSLDGDIECDISNAKITAYVPHDTDITDLVATYTTSCNSVKVQNVEQNSGVTHNDFTNGHYYTVTDVQGSQIYSVYLQKIRDDSLPNVYVDLDDSVTPEQKNTLLNGWQASDKEMKLPCTVTLTTDAQTEVFGAEEGAELATLKEAAATINLRGNSTMGSAKKPYKIKLSKKAQVLDMPKSKHWVVLASYDDKSFMRYYMGYELAHTCNKMEFSSHFRFVNFFLDGKYNGVYLIGEQIKIASERLDITEIENKAATDITGGYIIELNERRDDAEELLFEVTYKGRPYPFTIKSPDEEAITPEMNDYIKNYVQDFLNSLDDPSSHEYEKYIDVDTFIDWYITMELMRSHDASGYSSVYLNKDAGGKLCMGPVWDFNPGAGNVNYGWPIGMDTYEGLHIGGAIWWKYLFRDDKFKNAVKARWQELYATGFDGFLEKVDALEDYLTVPASDNFKRWDCLDYYVWAQPAVLHSYEAEVDMFRQWIKLRIEWLNEKYGA